MTYASELVDFENKFGTAWGATTPVAYGNVAGDASTAEFVRFNVIPSGALEMSIGSPGAQLHRYTGVAMVQIFVAPNEGELRARVLAQQAIDIFREAKFSNILCRSPYMIPIGVVDSYYQVNVVIPYQRDEIT